MKTVPTSMHLLRKVAPALLAMAVLPGCSTQPVHNALATWHASPNTETRKPQIIVLHITTQDSVETSLHTLTDASAPSPVSAHYLIGKDGHILQLVADLDRAWHAGGGRWGQIRDLNDASIGIELDNNSDGELPEAQFNALLRLLEDLCTRLHIPKSQVIAHADLAPTRRTDPGIHFPWQRLHMAGFGMWPATTAPAPAGFDGWLALQAVGYDIRTPAAALRAFRIHFRGRDDGEQTIAAFEPEDLAILHALVMQMR